MSQRIEVLHILSNAFSNPPPPHPILIVRDVTSNRPSMYVMSKHKNNNELPFL